MMGCKLSHKSIESSAVVSQTAYVRDSLKKNRVERWNYLYCHSLPFPKDFSKMWIFFNKGEVPRVS